MPDAARKWLEETTTRETVPSYGDAYHAVNHLRRLLEQNERLDAEVTDYLKICKNYANDLRKLLEQNERLVDALEHCGYDSEDCIDCGGPPHNDTCRFWKLRHVLSYWEAD